MKKMKKVLAMMLSLAMVFAMSLTAFAAEGGDPQEPAPLETTAVTPTAADKTTATVNNVEANATVTAYQIVKAKYNTNGFIGYEAVTGVTLADILVPTSDEITGIAKDTNLLDTLTSKTMTAGTANTEGLATFTAELEAGYWVVIVTGGERQVVYNPMLVGVYYNVSGSDNTLSNNAVDANSSWSLDSEPAYAKSNTPNFDKKITGSTTENGRDNTDSTLANPANNKGNDVAIGDIVKYQIDATIPSYSKSYTDVTVEISDTLSKGLDLEGTPVVKVDGGEVEASDATYTYTATEGKRGFTIAFASAYALANSGKEVVVTYNAKLNEQANRNFDPNTNTATYKYSNDPQNKKNVEELEEETYTYTFDIDGNLTGKMEGEWEKVTEELLKGHKVNTSTMTGKWEKYAPLAGAEFKLTNNVTGKEYTTTSDDKGLMYFGGLDAGEYTLIETKAPDGYTINNAKIPVVITATYNADGTLASYSIKVNNTNTSTYKATYNKDKVIEKLETEYKPTEEDPDGILSDAYIFWNTKLTDLPSTGGIGTTIFTIGGCIIMIIAAGLFFASRRKKAEN